MIEVDAISKWYGDHCALSNVTFEARPGDVTGLLGPNGAGKSTILRIITGCYHPDEGDVRVGGVSVRSDPSGARQSIGYLPERAPLYSDLTAGEHLRFAAEIRGLVGTAVTAAVDEVSQQCGIEPVLGRLCGRLSKGFRQRVALAQALIGNPQVLVLDELTTGLDPNQISETRGLVRQLARTRTVLFSTHILAEASALCDRVVILSAGRVVRDAPVAALTDGDRAVSVRVCAPPDAGQLRALAKVATVVRSSSDGREVELTLNGQRSAADVFDWAVESGLRLESLVPSERTLESLFEELTRGADAS